MCAAQELADCMAGDKRIGGDERGLLAGLIENKHPGIMTAYANYIANQVWQCGGAVQRVPPFRCDIECLGRPSSEIRPL